MGKSSRISSHSAAKQTKEKQSQQEITAAEAEKEIKTEAGNSIVQKKNSVWKIYFLGALLLLGVFIAIYYILQEPVLESKNWDWQSIFAIGYFAIIIVWALVIMFVKVYRGLKK